jgi:MinD superfamily P-loop ATPase
VRQEAKKIAETNHLPLIITDGPPGIGCPAIAALSGATLALAVVEPSLSSMHDLERLVDLVSHFNLPLTVCINKSTLHRENTDRLIAWCQNKHIPIVGQLPYSDVFRNAVQAGKTVMELNDTTITEQMTALWHNLAKRLEVPATPSELSVLQRFRQRFKLCD